MKKIIFSLVVLSLLIQFPVFAEETGTSGTPGTSLDQPQGVPALVPSVGKMNQLVATSDGGVIVFTGFRLLKYDANLNLVKEVQVNVQPIIPISAKQIPIAKKAAQPVVAESQESQEKSI
ncbi:MAG: hypothetical protein V1673_03870 [Candidatus Omnitrophota bacterium]